MAKLSGLLAAPNSNPAELPGLTAARPPFASSNLISPEAIGPAYAVAATTGPSHQRKHTAPWFLSVSCARVSGSCRVCLVLKDIPSLNKNSKSTAPYDQIVDPDKLIIDPWDPDPLAVVATLPPI